MDRASASDYIYAKASGMLSRSFVGENAARLFGVRSLSELWTLLFEEDVPAVPETLLAKRLEEMAAQKFIGEYTRLLSFYDRPDEVLVRLLEYFDYENLKSLGAAAAMGQKERPLIHKIEPFNLLDYSAWPSIQKITAGGSLSWYDKAPDVFEQQQLDTELDIQFIENLYKASRGIGGEAGKAARDLIVSRYSMRNILWVLRLKLYYKMEREDIVQRLAFLDPSSGEKDLFAGEALLIIDRNIDHFEDWEKWKYSNFLNPHDEGSVWSVDPRWVEEAFEKDFIRRALKLFHLYPWTPMVMVSWFFIKQKELDYIRSATEALRLNMEAESAMEAAGIR